MSLVLWLGLISLGNFASSVDAQNYSINWLTVDGGGNLSVGGAYAVTGTIGQPDAGAMSGGHYRLDGGFWSGLTDPGLEPVPVLSIRLGAGDQIVLRWRNPSTGYVLQQTADMSGQGGGWTSVTNSPIVVGPNKELTLTATGRFCMFRLRQP